MSAQPIALLAGPFDGSVPLVFLHRMEIFTSSNGQPCVPRRVICWDVGDMVSFLAAMQSNQGRTGHGAATIPRGGGGSRSLLPRTALGRSLSARRGRAATSCGASYS